MKFNEEALESIAKKTNHLTADFAVLLSKEFGEGGKAYETAIFSAATVLLFHAFRLGLHQSKDKAIGVLRALLEDTTDYIKTTSGIELEIEVHESRIRRTSD